MLLNPGVWKFRNLRSLLIDLLRLLGHHSGFECNRRSGYFDACNLSSPTGWRPFASTVITIRTAAISTTVATLILWPISSQLPGGTGTLLEVYTDGLPCRFNGRVIGVYVPPAGSREKDIPQLARNHGFEIGIEANHRVGCTVP